MSSEIQEFMPGRNGGKLRRGGGRPKKANSKWSQMLDAVRKELREKTGIVEDGEELTNEQVLAKIIVRASLEGNMELLQFVLKLADKDDTYVRDRKDTLEDRAAKARELAELEAKKAYVDMDPLFNGWSDEELEQEARRLLGA
jgi:hypothetical protein